MFKFLFVDEENAYEGPMAEVVLRDVFSHYDFEVSAKSRGLNVPEGKKYGNSTLMIISGIKEDIDWENADAVQLTQEDIDEADVVLAMTNEQKEQLKDRCPAEKLFTFFEYTMDSTDDLTSPKGYDLLAYRDCICGMGEAIGTLIEKWEKEKGSN